MMVTRPSIFMRGSRDVGSHRAKMDILEEGKEIFIPVAKDRLVSPLEKVAYREAHAVYFLTFIGTGILLRRPVRKNPSCRT